MTPTQLQYLLEDAARLHYDPALLGTINSITIGLQPLPVVCVHDIDTFDSLDPRGTVDSLVDKTTYVRRSGVVVTPRGPVTVEVFFDTEV